MQTQRRLKMTVILLVFAVLVSIQLGKGGFLAVVKTNFGFLCLTKAFSKADAISSEPHVYLNQGLSFLTSALKQNPTNTRVLRAVGDIQAGLGNENLAWITWKRGEIDFCLWIGRGDWYLMNSQLEEALAWYNRAVKAESTFADGWYGLGLTYKEREAFDKAAEAFQTAAEYPTYCRALGRSDALVELGGIYLWHMWPIQPTLALQAYRYALELNSFGRLEQKKIALRRASQLLVEQGEYLAAIDYTQELVRQSPEDDWAHMMLGISLYRGQADLDNALDHLELASNLTPNNPRPLIWMGEIYEERGERESAINVYQRVLNLAPDNERARQALRRLVSMDDTN